MHLTCIVTFMANSNHSYYTPVTNLEGYIGISVSICLWHFVCDVVLTVLDGIFSCTQTALSMVLSVCLSVTPFSLSSRHHIVKFSQAITDDSSDVHAKGRGQRSRSQSSLAYYCSTLDGSLPHFKASFWPPAFSQHLPLSIKIWSTCVSGLDSDATDLLIDQLPWSQQSILPINWLWIS